MTNTYQIKTKELFEGSVEILEMTDANGVISTVPMVPENADYQAYLRWLNGEPEPEPIVRDPAPVEALLIQEVTVNEQSQRCF